MKKVISFLMLLFATSTFAESGYAEHALMVHRLSYWAPDYLTVTNNWNNLCFINAPSTLKSLSVITEINGQNTKDMEPEDFYNIIDNESNFTISYLTKIRGENRSYKQLLTKRKGKLFCYDFNLSVEWVYLDRNDKDLALFSLNASITSDKNVDFFKFCTFDYMVSGEDYITDKDLLNDFGKELEKRGMKYDAEKPDVYLYLTKDMNSDIESIYVPKIVSTTTSNCYTKANGYIYFGNMTSWGHGNSSTHGSSITKIEDRGSTKTVVDANLHLQFAILDVKLMNEKKAPIVWQLTYNKHYTYETNLISQAKEVHQLLYPYPLTDGLSIGRKIVSYGLFIDGSLSKSGKISDIINNGYAYNHGIKVGDILKKIKLKTEFKHTDYTYDVGKGIKFETEKMRTNYFDKITLQMDSQSLTIKPNEYRELNVSYYYLPESVIQ